MGFFGKILEKLGIRDAAAATTTAPQGGGQTASGAAPTAPAAPAAPAAIPVVDVVAQLEKRAAANPQKLNWRTSIVDLLTELNDAGTTIVVITHDNDLALHFPRRVSVRDGRIVHDDKLVLA